MQRVALAEPCIQQYAPFRHVRALQQYPEDEYLRKWNLHGFGK